MRRALVLGGGGVTGIAWELGMLAGLAEHGVDLSSADVVICTSAGAVVGAQLACGLDLRQRYEAQLAPIAGETAPPGATKALLKLIWASMRAGTDAQAFRERMGRTALNAKTPSEEERLRTVARWLGEATEWPARELLITAVDTASGEFAVFDAASGADLVRAVAASCSSPGVRPPITIGGRRYTDGGIRSPLNLDLAKGCSHVVALAPVTRAGGPVETVEQQRSRLGAAQVVIITPEEATRKAIGTGLLDPSRRAPAARAGHAQAAAAADLARSGWQSHT
ncbi:patatin-like phospholipase family protein [Nonomuraea sp. NEAU-A123]|uniref:patatin-like phospholipase family protein n=1 Tax=Nonomuraea sp. NEAU-A123 TaxID=2839649 RepID=UPI001BE3EC92|nr:patatin-like phospholipase family protein [Nonomuraea sp. NEAU-A123]MBT2230455.1 patatin-like phospholipase family protein [Nonomuraea sp. NEAU-A123]